MARLTVGGDGGGVNFAPKRIVCSAPVDPYSMSVYFLNLLLNHLRHIGRICHDPLVVDCFHFEQVVCCEWGANRNDMHIRIQGCLHTARRIFKNECVFGCHIEFACHQIINFRVRFAVIDIVTACYKVKLITQFEYIQYSLYLRSMTHRCQPDLFAPLRTCHFEHINIMGPLVVDEYLWVSEHLFIILHSDTHKCLPGGIDP